MSASKLPSINDRITRLESDIAVIGRNQAALEDRMNDVQSSMRSMEESLSKSLSRIEERFAVDQARRLPPIPTILGTIATTFLIASMTVAGLFFLIDARVSSAVTESAAWTHEWKDGGKLYNSLSDIYHRLEIIEGKKSVPAR